MNDSFYSMHDPIGLCLGMGVPLMEGILRLPLRTVILSGEVLFLRFTVLFEIKVFSLLPNSFSE